MWNYLWYSRINRKWYFFLNWALLVVLQMATKMKVSPELVQILGYIAIILSIFIIRARCNDIGLHQWMQFGIQAGMLLVILIPFISIIPHLYLLCKKGMYTDCDENSKKSFLERIEDMGQAVISAMRDVNHDSLVIIRKLFMVFFCAVTLIMFLVPPYHIVHPKAGERFVGYGTIITPPKDTKYITIDYKRLVFQEIILLAACGAGYTIITLTKK